MSIDKKMLEDGLVLQTLVIDFNEKKDATTLTAVCSCLRDSDIWVPCQALLSENDRKRLESFNPEKDDGFAAQDEIRLKPDTLKNGDKMFFPVFSSPDVLPEEYASHFSVIKKPFLETLELAGANEDLAGMVLDAFTNPFIIDRELFDKIPMIPSQIEEGEKSRIITNPKKIIT